MSTNSALPLAGVRVLDLSSLTPGPFATLMLTELGAAVVKVERPGGGDPLRAMLPGTFDLLNRGKASLSLDLKQPADRDLLLGLAAEADVFVEGFRPGVADRLGVGFEAVSRRSPGIVYASLSGYGQTGPLVHTAGHDLNYVARAGGIALGGVSDGVPGYDGTYQVADLAMAAHTVIAVLAALRGPRDEAVHVDVSLLGSALAFTQLAAAEARDTGHADRPVLRGREQRAANGVFLAGDDLPLTICAVEDHFWVALCAVLGRDDLSADPDYLAYADRLRHGERLNATIAQALSARGRDEWIELLDEAGVPCAPVLTYGEAVASEQVAALGIASGAGAVDLPLRGLPRVVPTVAPALGQHDRALRGHGWSAVADDERESAR